MTQTASQIRQDYLEAAVRGFRAHFKRCGYDVPANLRISVGFPKGSHGGKRAVGQCWPWQVSTDKTSEAFISPELRETRAVLETIAHEMVHHTVGCEAGHKGLFKKCAEAVGFIAPMTSTPAGPKMKDAIQVITADIGKYPAGALMVGDRKRQGTRLLKCECADCGYTVRITRKWVEQAGTPLCPTDDISMVCETIDDEEG